MSPVDESTIESDELGELDGLDELEFLSRAAVILAEMRPDDDIFAFVGNALARLAPDSLLAVCSYEPDIESTVLRTLAGPSDMRALAEEVLGPPIGLQFRLNRCAQRMREGNLLQVEDMRQLSFETWDLELSRRLEATLGIRGIFGQAFARRGDFLGTVSIVSRRSRLEHTELIEAFINLAGVALRRLRAEAKLYESESRFRMLAENSRDVIYRLRVEPTPQFEYVSPASTQVVGLRPQELYENVELGAGCLYPKDWITTTRPRDVPEDAIVVPCKRGDGTLRWTEQKFSAVRDERGEIVAFEGIVRDVTSRKNAQDALVEADRRKDEFLAVLSHELRNPLTPIRHGLYILAHAEPGSSQANRARTIMERQVNHLSRLLDDLLDVTRIVRKKISLQLVSLDLGELVRATVDDHRPLFADRKIDVDVDVDVPSEAVMINGDVTRLAQVIGNLLQNAAKFTPEGGKTSVALCTDGAAKKAIVRVRDTGEGMAPAILAHLFEPFTQAETTLDRSRGGLGVGLSLVKELVELHSGTVFVRSDGPGKGTEITVRLPLSESVSMRAEPKANLGHEPTRVLIIEDNVDGAETLCEALKLGGHVVEIAYTGPEGLEKARCFRPDIVFCDIGLPQMDGYAVARAIRQTPELSDLKLVALTGYISAEDIAKSRAAGFDRHLAKPPTIDLLEKTVKELARAPAKKVGDPARAPGGRF